MSEWSETVEYIVAFARDDQKSRWELADRIATLLPDGTPEVRKLIDKLYEDINKCLSHDTLTSYRETSLVWKVEDRILEKRFWFHAQARFLYKRSREAAIRAVVEAENETHLRSLIGQRAPHRIDTQRVHSGLRNIETAKRLLSPDLIRLWLMDEDLRERFISELETTHGMMFVRFKQELPWHHSFEVIDAS